MGDNNKGGNQKMSEEEDGGKRVDESSSSDHDEDKNQYEDNNNKANKEKITTSFWENGSDEENEWNEQGSTDGDINRDDKTQDESEINYASDNVEHKDDSNKQKSGGMSKNRGDDDITGIGHKDKKKGKGLKKEKVLISFRGWMMISLGFQIDTNDSLTKYSFLGGKTHCAFDCST